MHEDIVRLHDDQYYIHAASARLDDRTRVLKQGDTFAVLTRHGEIDPLARAQFGIFHHDTRHVSRLAVRLQRGRLLLLSSASRADNALLAVDLTNPDFEENGEVVIPRGTLHLFRSIVLWNAAYHEQLRVHNYGRDPAALTLRLLVDADFADIFEVRGMERATRGRRLPAELSDEAIVLSYEGLDGITRRTRFRFDPVPTELTATEARFQLTVGPQAAATIRLAISCDAHPVSVAGVERPASNGADPLRYERAAELAIASLRTARAAEPSLHTDHEQFNNWWDRSVADLHILQTETPSGLYPYAGVPWFSTPFGRDGILTALSCLWLSPGVARGVLAYLASTQADAHDPEADAQPGKILHETRGGEMAALGEVPFARYYGSVDSTPLFVMLASAYHVRTGDLAFLQSLWPNIERALQWIDESGDVDGDGFVEYARQSERGLVHQGWKDSHDSVFHENGDAADGPIALCEVQAYAYAAKAGAAQLAMALGDSTSAEKLAAQADALRARFEEAFWCDRIATYALALDGEKRQCRVRSSNAGHCLFAGIATADRAARVADTLMKESSFSGWGIRTIASTERRYNPMSYHNGSVWPHDNALIAAGFGHYGLRVHAARVLEAMLEASAYFELHRLPELFCGFAKRPGESPTLYPTACSPQAWAAATPFACLQACLGMEIDGARRRIVFRNPVLPTGLENVEIDRLQVGDASVDLLIRRLGDDVAVGRKRREDGVEVVVEK